MDSNGKLSSDCSYYTSSDATNAAACEIQAYFNEVNFQGNVTIGSYGPSKTSEIVDTAYLGMNMVFSTAWAQSGVYASAAEIGDTDNYYGTSCDASAKSQYVSALWSVDCAYWSNSWTMGSNSMELENFPFCVMSNPTPQGSMEGRASYLSSVMGDLNFGGVLGLGNPGPLGDSSSTDSDFNTQYGSLIYQMGYNTIAPVAMLTLQTENTTGRGAEFYDQIPISVKTYVQLGNVNPPSTLMLEQAFGSMPADTPRAAAWNFNASTITFGDVYLFGSGSADVEVTVFLDSLNPFITFPASNYAYLMDTL